MARSTLSLSGPLGIESATALMTPSVALSVQLLRLHGVMYSLVFALICGARWDSALNAAAATMLTQGQNVIVRIVAVSHRGILAPCGACREFISQLSPLNLNAEVLVNETDVARLGDLMPYRWPD